MILRQREARAHRLIDALPAPVAERRGHEPQHDRDDGDARCSQVGVMSATVPIVVPAATRASARRIHESSVRSFASATRGSSGSATDPSYRCAAAGYGAV